MITNDDIESYLDRLGTPYDKVDDGFWVVGDDDGKIVVRHDHPIIVFRTKLMDVPAGNRAGLYEKLLQLNASEMITAAYGLEENAIVAVASLQSQNLDYNEFHGAVDALTMAMTEHIDVIRATAE